MKPQQQSLTQQRVQQWAQMRQAQQAQQQPEQGRSILESFLPAVGGIIGGIGGSFLSPIAGTAAGAAGGSALGETLAQLFSGESDDGFDFGNIAQEGALGGAFSMVAPVLRVGSGLARGGTSAIGSLDDLGRVAAGTAKVSRGGQLVDKAARGNIFQKLGQGAQRKAAATILQPGAAGLDDAVFKFGVDPIDDFVKLATQSGTSNVDDFIKSGGIIDDLVKAGANQIDDAVKIAGNPTISGQQVIDDLIRQRDLAARALGSADDVARLDKLIATATKKYAKGIKLNDALKTAKDANKVFGKNIISTDKGAAKALAQKIEANALKSTFKSQFPDIAEGLAKQQRALTLRPILQRSAAKGMARGFQQGFGQGGGLLSRGFDAAMSSQAISGNLAQGGLGAAKMTGLGNALASVNRFGGQAGRGLAGTTMSQTLPRAAGAVMGMGGSQTPVEPMVDEMGLGMGGFGMGGMTPPVQNPANEIYPQDALLSDIQRDPANMAKYIEYYALLQETFAPQATSPYSNVGVVSAQNLFQAQTGLQALADLEQLIAQDPNVVSRTATPGRQLPVVGGYIAQAAGTTDYDTLGYNIADAIIRISTGAQANESEIRNLQSQLMPRAGDSPENIRTKLDKIYQRLAPVLELAQGGGAQTNQLAAALGGI